MKQSITHWNISKVYNYKGLLFNYHYYCGPLFYSGPLFLKKDGEPCKRQGGRKFKEYEEWEKLSGDEQEKYRI